MISIEETQQTYSQPARCKWFAAGDAYNKTVANLSRINDQQLGIINQLYCLAVAAYDCQVYKNLRKRIATVKVADANAPAHTKDLITLNEFCVKHGVTKQRNINTRSLSYVFNLDC